ncbi:MAG TPA: hypothetical protein PLD20_21665 [Blastocatellia bacterium]|nr:hypothetical protein [Blastocatellia bacterium]HMV87464.1 hypothetical protein [Blastocatellia bacterium]HMX26347.1 hypothetical protein [Blastocatellia bacterium]HMY71892.1 hypothetical protein [Blastocatellia bacterium]HMZ20560.1 hypothetical protein [Blastocatellia bacterium]
MTTCSKPKLPRREFLTTACLAIAANFSGCNRAGSVENKNTKKAIEALNEIVQTIQEHKVDRHLRAAIELQALGKASACEVLLAFTSKYDSKSMTNSTWAIKLHEMVALCRMLFVKRPNSEFRRAMIGAAGFLGGTDYGDWPLEPIEIVDGIPFSVVNGYVLGGFPELVNAYLNYCIGNCDWNSFQFEMKTDAQKQEALRKLLASPKWKRELTTWDKDFFSAQIR